MRRLSSLLLLFMALWLDGTAPMNVLIYNPHIGFYHTKFMTTIANHLHDEGHNVTILDSEVNSDLRSAPRREGIHNVTVKQNRVAAEILRNGEDRDTGLKAFWEDLTLIKKFWGMFGFYWKMSNFSTMCAAQCRDVVVKDTMDTLRAGRYDLAITEVFDLCGVGIFNIIDPGRIVLASSVPLHDYLGEMLGLPKAFDVAPPKFSLSTMPEFRNSFEAMSGRSMIQSAMESALWGANMFYWLEKEESEIFSKYSPNVTFPGFKEILRRAHSLLENVHPLIDLNKPTLNSILPIGGITVDEPVPLEEEMAAKLEKDCENKKRVLVSFGTVMNPRTMKNETRRNLIWAMGNVSEAVFFWKGEASLVEEMDVPPNVRMDEWMPQNDLLGSGKIDLFVSHMGIGSLSEAAFNGVPLVSVPIFVDQHYNHACAVRLGVARFVDRTSLTLTSQDLTVAIRDALLDEEAKRNSTKLRKRLIAYGSQRQRMIDHFNYILSLPSDTKSLSFFNHHEGFGFALSVLSIMGHLMPRYLAHLIMTGLASLSFLVLFQFFGGKSYYLLCPNLFIICILAPSSLLAGYIVIACSLPFFEGVLKNSMLASLYMKVDTNLASIPFLMVFNAIFFCLYIGFKSWSHSWTYFLPAREDFWIGMKYIRRMGENVAGLLGAYGVLLAVLVCFLAVLLLPDCDYFCV